MISTVVVLPAPLGPRTATSSPRATVIDTPLTTARPSYRLTSSSTMTAGSLPAAPPVTRRSLGDQGVVVLEVGVLHLTDLDRSQDPVPIDEVRLRPAGHAVGGLERLVRVGDRRPCRAVLGH